MWPLSSWTVHLWSVILLLNIMSLLLCNLCEFLQFLHKDTKNWGKKKQKAKQNKMPSLVQAPTAIKSMYKDKYTYKVRMKRKWGSERLRKSEKTSRSLWGANSITQSDTHRKVFSLTQGWSQKPHDISKSRPSLCAILRHTYTCSFSDTHIHEALCLYILCRWCMVHYLYCVL